MQVREDVVQYVGTGIVVLCAVYAVWCFLVLLFE